MKEKFNLIEGIFNAQDARDILLSLIHEKIKFHDLKSLSWEEKSRFFIQSGRTKTNKSQNYLVY